MLKKYCKGLVGANIPAHMLSFSSLNFVMMSVNNTVLSFLTAMHVFYSTNNLEQKQSQIPSKVGVECRSLVNHVYYDISYLR